MNEIDTISIDLNDAKHNGGEGDVGESWLVLFPMEKLQEINDDYKESLPIGHIIIGSNGGGKLFGLNSFEKYFIVPEIIEEEYLEVMELALKIFQWI